MIYTIDKSALLEEAFRIDSPEKAEKFARRSTRALNHSSASKTFNNAAAASMAPTAGMLVGGAAGNSVHGDGDLSYADKAVMKQDDIDQEVNDDEYDMTGAAIGAGLGTIGQSFAAKRLLHGSSINPIKQRLAKHGYNTTSQDDSMLRKGAAAVRLNNLNNAAEYGIRKGTEFGQRMRG